MSIYDEQIRERTKYDDEFLNESFLKMSDAITGARRADNFGSNSAGVDYAIEDILKYFHIKLSPDMEIFNKNDGFEEKLDCIFNPNGIMRRQVELDKDWYKTSYGPYLGFLKGTKESVAILPNPITGFYYLDKNTGKKIKINSKNKDIFEDLAYYFYRPFPMKRLGIPDMLAFILKQVTMGEIVYTLLFYLLAVALSLLVPKFTRLLYGPVVNTKSMQLLLAAGVFMICTSISRIIITGLRSFVIQRLSVKVSVNVQAATMMRLLSLSPSFFREYQAGQLSSISSHMTGFCKLLIDTFISSSLESLFSIVFVVQIFEYSPTLVLPSVVIVALTVVFNIISTFVRMDYSKKIMQLQAKSDGISYALLNGVEKIKLSGAEKRAFFKWAEVYSKQAEYSYNPPLFLKINGEISAAISAVGVVVMYYLSAKAGLGLAEYTAFTASFGLFSGAFSSLTGIVSKVANIRPSLEMCKPILEAVPESSELKPVATNVKGDVNIENISFRYNEDSPYIFEDFSLHIKKGDYTAIVGKTGCGKSTLVRLMLGFEKPEIGVVSIDGRNIEQVDINSIRRHIGTVIQNGKLFQGTVLENIIVAAPHASLEDAWEAARIAGLDEDIENMPMGMNTIIGEGQGGVSGGQKQRLMIARAIVGKPNLLILDEATSALDNVTQKKVSDALASLKCTRIVIAHRLSTIKECNRIVVIDGGKIIQDGDYDTLVNQEGFFKELVERQMVEGVKSEAKVPKKKFKPRIR